MRELVIPTCKGYLPYLPGTCKGRKNNNIIPTFIPTFTKKPNWDLPRDRADAHRCWQDRAPLHLLRELDSISKPYRPAPPADIAYDPLSLVQRQIGQFPKNTYLQLDCPGQDVKLHPGDL